LLPNLISKKGNGLPVVGIPSLLRDLTHGQRSVSVDGDTVRKVIDNLDVLFPGLKERLCEDNHLRPSIAIVVDGHTSALKLRQRLKESSEVHFVISISGGKS
jgi:molybdopterin synthase sulfur carrier subunit